MMANPSEASSACWINFDGEYLLDVHYSSSIVQSRELLSTSIRTRFAHQQWTATTTEHPRLFEESIPLDYLFLFTNIAQQPKRSFSPHTGSVCIYLWLNNNLSFTVSANSFTIPKRNSMWPNTTALLLSKTNICANR